MKHGYAHGCDRRRIQWALIGSVALVLGLLGLAPAVAGAAPSNAPTALSGTFDCGNGQTGTFLINSGKAENPTTWEMAHLTFSSGGSGIFVPTAIDITFTVNGQSQTVQATKGSAPGSVTCSISAAQDGFTLSGSVTGNIVHLR
jgi:hypothetical protein